MSIRKEDVLAAADCRDYLEGQGYKPLRSQGETTFFNSPLRIGADSGSFKVDRDKWFDHVSKEGGGFLELYASLNGMDINSDFAAVVKSAGLAIGLRDEADAKRIAHQINKKPLPPRIHKYMTFDGRDAEKHIPVECKSKTKWFLDGKAGLDGALVQLFGIDSITGQSDIVCLVEGEKDAENLHAIGVPAVSLPNGATSKPEQFKPEWLEQVKGMRVVVIPDNDTAGAKHLAAVREAMTAANIENHALILEGLPSKGDVSDWLERGNTENELWPLIMEALDGTGMELPKGPGFEFYSIPDLEAYETPKDHYVLGEGFMRRGAGTLLAGGTGIGKSILAAQVSVAAAGGGRFLGCIPAKGSYKVLHIQAENDPETMKRDFISIMEASQGVDPQQVRKNLVVAHTYGMTGSVFTTWLETQCEFLRPDVIVIDPYQSFVGADDINNTKGFLEWIGPVNHILQEYMCALLLVAHTPKPRDRSDWNTRELVYSAAGSSAISNWARTSMELHTLKQEESRFKLTFSKNSERTGLLTNDQRPCRELFIRHSETIKHPFWHIDEDQDPPETTGLAHQIKMELIKDGSRSDAEIACHLGCNRSTVYRKRKEMEA